MYYWKLQVPIKDYGVLVGCPHIEVRRKWLPKAIEEDGEDIIGGEHVPHPEYWLKFCEGVGLSREYVINAEPLPGVKFAVDHWTHGAAKSWLHGVAMSETGDSAKGIARNLETIRKHYSWIPEWALEFWTLHSEVDVEHSQLSMEILGKYCTTKELQEECIEAMLTYQKIHRVMRDSVYLEYVVLDRQLPEGTLDPARLAVLADALEDAGCSDADLLSHLRSPGPHVRGCRALGLVLGRE